MRAFKYLSVFSFPVLAALAFAHSGWLTFLPMIYAFILIPITEQVLKRSPKNLIAAETEMIKKDNIYDLLLHLTAFVHIAFVIWFLFTIRSNTLPSLDIIGRITSMGVLFGVTGINVAHELGHRQNKFDQFLSQTLLFSTQYTHFFIEHNQGHHKNVSTYEDPASARKGENIYSFWMRSIFFTYLSAWNIQNKELHRKNISIISVSNKMLIYSILQLASLIVIWFFFGKMTLVYYFFASVIGIVFLETINYIEHYGLSRKKLSDHKYEKTQPWHSWNSNHVLGRIILFELTRHSDHHYDASKKYQLLDSHENAPDLPLGYPASMLLSLFPPLWFWVMNKRIDKIEEEHGVIQKNASVAP